MIFLQIPTKRHATTELAKPHVTGGVSRWSKIIAENPPRILNSWRIQRIENEHFMQKNKSSDYLSSSEHQDDINRYYDIEIFY